ncbi:hypothetical protein [Glycomyces xiaoerkulensis]|uniref:hypothetical protein n=1 Tax=Glycomyces xiaoerkulensis TaxID=2038139 RepID=UPI0012FFD3CA|nr:hypothetical protein [Glycomyces xiaoerkulensis]
MASRDRCIGRVRKLLVTSGIGLLGAVGIASCGPDDAETAADDAEASGPGESSEEPVAFGDAAEIGAWTVSIGEVEFDAAEQIEDYEDFNRYPSEGQTFILVALDITYNGEGAGGTYYTFDCTLWNGGDALGGELRDIAVPDPLDRVGPVQSGSRASGHVLFEAPEGDYDGMLLGVEAAGERHYFALA